MAAPDPWAADTVGRNSIFMVDLLAIIMGTAFGFLSGLGTGGGSLLILWLTIAVGMPQEIARSINLLFYIPSALIAVAFRAKQGSFSLRELLPAIISGCIAAGTFAVLSNYANIDLLKKLFGLLLLFIGIRELLYRPRKAR